MSKSSRIANRLLDQARGIIGREIPQKEKKQYHPRGLSDVAKRLMDNLPSRPITGSIKQLLDKDGSPWPPLSRKAEEHYRAQGQPIPKPIIKRGEGKVHTKPVSQDLIEKVRGKLK